MTLRGLRWQLAALIVSMLLFGMVAVLRIADTFQPSPTPSPTLSVASATPTALPPTSTAIPTPVAIAATPLPEDSVPTFVEGVVGNVQRLNPLLVSNQAERDITSLIFEGLTRINTFGEPEGLLAESWVVSRDGTEYVFTLRQNILWQDGIAFTADDVIFTFNLLGSDNLASNPAIADFWKTVEIQKLNDYQIRFRLAQPLASFPSLLTIGILPVHALRGTDAGNLSNHPFNLTPIGTGAYQLEALRSNSGNRIEVVDLRIAPNFRQRPEAQGRYAIDRMRFRIFENFAIASAALSSGLTDGLATSDMNQRDALINTQDVSIYTQTASVVGVLIYNWNESDDTRFFSDTRVRSALNMGIDYRSPVESSMLNKAILADSPLLPSSWAYNETIAQAASDVSQARNILENSNIQVSEDSDFGEALYAFSILVDADNPHVGIAQQLAAQWQQLNLSVSVDAVDNVTYQQRLVDGDFDVAIVELALPADPDVYAYWHSSQYPDGLNYGAVADDRVNEQLERARREPNGLNRIALYNEFQQAFISRAVGQPLYYPLFTYAVDDIVRGIQLGYLYSPENRFYNIADWRIEVG